MYRKRIRLKLYEIQNQSDEQLRNLPTSAQLNEESFHAISTALSVTHYGFTQFIASSILNQFGIVEHPSETALEGIRKQDDVLKSFIAGNIRLLRNCEDISFDTVLCNHYNVLYNLVILVIVVLQPSFR